MEHQTPAPADLATLADTDLLVAWDDATAAAEAAEWDEPTTREVERIEQEVVRRGLDG